MGGGREAAAEGMCRQRKASGRIRERGASWAPLCCSGSFSRRSPESRREVGAAPVSQAEGKTVSFYCCGPHKTCKTLARLKTCVVVPQSRRNPHNISRPRTTASTLEFQVTPSLKVDVHAGGGEEGVAN